MKKLFSVLLALCMIAALCPAAWAARDDQAQQFTKVAVWGEHVYYAAGDCLSRSRIGDDGTVDDDVEGICVLNEEVLGIAPGDEGLYILTKSRIYMLLPEGGFDFFYDNHSFELDDGELIGRRSGIADERANLEILFDGALDGWELKEAYLYDGRIYVSGSFWGWQTVMAIEDGKVMEGFSPISAAESFHTFQHLGHGLLFGGNKTFYFSFEDDEKYNEEMSFQDNAFRIIDATDPELGGGPMLSYFSTVTVDDMVYFYGPTGSAYAYDVDKDEIEAMEEEIPHLTGYSDVFTWDGKIYYLAQEQQSFVCYDPKTGESVLLDGTIPVDSGTRLISSSAYVHDGVLYWVPDYETGLLRVDLETGDTQVSSGPMAAYLVDLTAQYQRYNNERVCPYYVAGVGEEGNAGIEAYTLSRYTSGISNRYYIDIETLTGEDDRGKKVDFNVVLDK